MRPKFLLLVLAVLYASSALAYGGWKPMSFWEAYWLVVGRWMSGLIIFVVLYVAFSFWLENWRRTLFIPVLLHGVVCAFVIAPLGAVMGAPGPAHVVSDMNMLTFMFFCILLWAKASVLGVLRFHKKFAPKERPIVATGEGAGTRG